MTSVLVLVDLEGRRVPLLVYHKVAGVAQDACDVAVVPRWCRVDWCVLWTST